MSFLNFISEEYRRYLPVTLMLIGGLLLVYVGWVYTDMSLTQRSLAREFEEQQKQAAAQPSAVAVADDGLTRISIPKIDVEAIVLDGTSHKQLAKGPGRILDTAIPGANGNSVITAHRDTYFRKIGDLQTGDPVIVQRNGREYRFEVTGRKVVEPTDLSVLRQTQTPQLTLITCYPTYYIGPAPERLVVFSKLVEERPLTAPAQAASAGQ
jgi:sortase A